MQRTYNISKSHSNAMLIAVRDFLLGLDNYTLIKDISNVVPDKRIKPFFDNGTYSFMVFRDDTYNVYLIFFIFKDNFSCICSTDFVNGKDIWYQKNVHYNGHTLFKSNESSTTTINNYVYYVPSPTAKVSDSTLIANFNKNKNTVMLNFVYDVPVDYGTSVEHTISHTRSIVFGGYNQYNSHIGGFFFGGDFVYTYELIHRSKNIIHKVSSNSIASIWNPSQSYTVGQIVKLKANDTTLYLCVASHTSSSDISMDMSNWKSFVVPFTAHNTTYMYSYIDYVCDSRFCDPAWHIATDIRHANDSKNTWVAYPKLNDNCRAYSLHAPSPYNQHRLELLALAYVDYYYNKTEDIIKDFYLTDTDSPAFSTEVVGDLNVKIKKVENMIKNLQNSWDVELEALRKQMLADPIISDIHNLLDILPDIRIKKHEYEIDSIDSVGLLDRLYALVNNLGDVGLVCDAISSTSLAALRKNLTFNYIIESEYASGLDTLDIIDKLSNFLSSGGFDNVKSYLHSNYIEDARYCDDFIDGALVKSFSLFIDVCRIAVRYSDFPYTVILEKDKSNVQSISYDWYSYVSSLPSSISNKDAYSPNFLISVYIDIINSYKNSFDAINSRYEINIELKKRELAELKDSELVFSFGNKAYSLPDVTEDAVWCSTMKLGNCVEMNISADDTYVDLPNYASLMTVSNNTNHYVFRNTLNGSSLVLPLYFMVRRQPYELDTWSALGYTNIVNIVDMSYMSTNSYKNGNYPDDFTTYFCYRMGFGGDMFCKDSYPGLAFSSNEDFIEDDKVSIFDIDTMDSLKVGGSDVLNLYNPSNHIYAYGGDTVFANDIPNGSIFFTESVYDYTYIEILYSDAAVSFVKSVIWNKRELLSAIYGEDRFDLLKGSINGTSWFISPTGSTDFMLSGSGQNCGIIDIRGYEVI